MAHGPVDWKMAVPGCCCAGWWAMYFYQEMDGRGDIIIAHGLQACGWGG